MFPEQGLWAGDGRYSDEPQVSVIIPCLDEAATIACCVQKARSALAQEGIAGEVIVVDNGSTDDSASIAERAGARVVVMSACRGYGCAVRAGIFASRGRYVIMGDGDGSYDFCEMPAFLERLRAGCHLVMGTRLRGTILAGAMPRLHRWLGVPLLTALGNCFFGTRLSDYHCGLRGFERQAIERLGLRTMGMEFATEMIAKAALHGLVIGEVPITYYPDGRSRPSHLRTWRDGWRHLVLLLLLSPRWVFLYPGFALLLLGLLGSIWLLPGPRMIGSVGFDVHTLLVSGVAVILGAQVLTLWLCAQLFAGISGLLPISRLSRFLMERFSLGAGLALGAALAAIGLALLGWSLGMWANVDFGALDYQVALRRLIPGLVLLALGIHGFFASFIISLLAFKTRVERQ